MSNDWLRPPQDPISARLKEWILHADVVASEIKISKELLHRARVETWADPMTQQILVRLQACVYKDVIKVDREAVPFRREVPWKTTVMVTHERTWWQRLWRRSAKVTWHEIEGVVEVAGKVPITTEFAARFPDLPTNYPAEWGRPIRAVSMDWEPPLWDSKITRADLPQIYDPEENRAYGAPTEADKYQTAAELREEHRAFWQEATAPEEER